MSFSRMWQWKLHRRIWRLNWAWQHDENLPVARWKGGGTVILQSVFTEYKIINNQYGRLHFIFILIGLTSTVLFLAQSRKKRVRKQKLKSPNSKKYNFRWFAHDWKYNTISQVMHFFFKERKFLLNIKELNDFFFSPALRKRHEQGRYTHNRSPST